MKLNSKHPKFNSTLVTYLKTKQGTAFALDVLSQLITGFELDKNGRITSVEIDTDTGITLNLE